MEGSVLQALPPLQFDRKEYRKDRQYLQVKWDSVILQFSVNKTTSTSKERQFDLLYFAVDRGTKLDLETFIKVGGGFASNSRTSISGLTKSTRSWKRKNAASKLVGTFLTARATNVLESCRNLWQPQPSPHQASAAVKICWW